MRIMKERYLFYIFFIVLLLGGCKCNTDQSACELYVYMGGDKIYQIYFNGKDSLETICGVMEKDKYRMLIYSRPLPKGENAFDSVYVKKMCRLSQKQAIKIATVLNLLNSKVVADTIEKGVKDVWHYALYLPKQTINLELVKNNDEDVNSLLELLIDNSPYYVNMASTMWYDQEIEEQIIRECGRHKLSLSPLD